MALNTLLCAVLLILPRPSWSYKYESLLNPEQSDVSSNEHGEYYSESYEYHRWNLRGGHKNNTRSEDGTLKIINILPAHKHQKVQEVPTRKDSGAAYDGIVFPETPVRHRRINFLPEIPEECKKTGSSLCTNVPNYPEEYIDKLLNNRAEEWKHTEDKLLEKELKINQRMGEEADDAELCQSNQNIVYPKAAENKDNKWFSIINTSHYLQGFRVETCTDPKAQCDSVATFRYGVVSSCKQKYVLREMKALDSNGEVVTDYFKLPSCCTCVYKYNI